MARVILARWGADLWPRPSRGRRMREMIFKALNLGSEYAQADGEAMDLTEPRP